MQKCCHSSIDSRLARQDVTYHQHLRARMFLGDNTTAHASGRTRNATAFYTDTSDAPLGNKWSSQGACMTPATSQGNGRVRLNPSRLHLVLAFSFSGFAFVELTAFRFQCHPSIPSFLISFAHQTASLWTTPRLSPGVECRHP